MSWAELRAIAEPSVVTINYGETAQFTLGVELAGTMTSATMRDPQVYVEYAGGPADELVFDVEGVGRVVVKRGEKALIKTWSGTYPFGTRLTVGASIRPPLPNDPSDTQKC